MSANSAPSLAYFFGQDAYGLERAARVLRSDLEAAAGEPLEVWRVSGEDDDAPAPSDAGTGPHGTQPTTAGRRRARMIDELEQRLATAPLFGAGTLLVVRQPVGLMRDSAARERLIGLLGAVAPGNALCFVELLPAAAKPVATSVALRDAVANAGGIIREFPALGRERMEAFVTERAAELGFGFAPGAARLLAERVGAFVREGDVDRRRQSELANAELEKLALYRPNGVVSREDVIELVTEAVPGSAWALLDALGARRVAEASALVERLLDEGTALPVLVSQLHRRLRELVVIRDHLAAGTRPPDLVRALRLQPFRAQKLSEQARSWQPAELDQALTELLAVDLLSKGIAPDGNPRSLSDERSRLALLAWLVERVGVGRRPPAPAGARSRG